MLLTTREHARHVKKKMARPERLAKVRLSMKRLKHVVHERSIVYKRLLEYKKLHLDGGAALVSAVDAEQDEQQQQQQQPEPQK